MLSVFWQYVALCATFSCMDDIDRKILAQLQKDGRLTITELSERIGLSLSPCQRRLRALEDEKIISGYRATINPAAVGLNFSAIVFATLRHVTVEDVASFENALQDIPEITRAERLFGDPDYMLQVVARDLPAFQMMYDRKLLTLPSLLRLTSTIVMKSICQDRPLPLS
ncbi:MAG TPA: Lrp/AsnC family transcriptional regulator [Pararobbsia sp.]|nr:Lrp/AsnC family transcriptional regulator [Pararobbsia sp.]